MRLPGWAFLVGIVGLVAATAICGAVAFVSARQFAIDIAESTGQEVAGIDNLLAAVPSVTPTLTLAPTQTAAPTATLPPGVTPSPTVVIPTATPDILGPRRINVLLMGIDQRRGETGAFRTDTMLIASIDPVRRTVGLLSIPRDLYVEIPGYQQYRINQANYIGDLNNYPGGGPALAMATVTQNLGIQVDKYVMVNFDLFETVVRLVAPRGAEVCPTEAIDDPDYPDAGYGTIAVYFPPGCQRLDGVRLLQYARTRATQGGDFDRAARQQEVLQSLRNELLNAGGIVNFIGVAPQLWLELNDSYRTNMSLEEIISLGTLALEIPRENIRTGTIGVQQTRPATTAEGDQVLIPVYGAMRDLFSQVFGTGPAPAAVSDIGDLRAQADAEGASIVVFNNTAIAGLAGQTREWLTSRGVRVTDIGNMNPVNDQPTYIVDYGNKPFTAQYLAAQMGIPNDRIRLGTDGLTTADILIVVGSDMQSVLNGS